MEQVLTAAVRQPGHDGDDGAGVDAAGEEGAERHFGDHPQADGFFEAVGQFGAGVGIADRVVEGEADIPVFARLADRLAAAQQQGVGRGQFFGLLEDGARLGDVAEGEVFLDGAGVDFALEAAVGEQRLEFGAEKEGAIVEQGVEQRLDAEAVAGEKQGFAVAVPEGEGEHAAEAVDAALAPGFPGVDDDFGVAAGVEDVAERLQFGDEFLVVVDFAVEDDADALVFVVQRLLAGGQVDDRQPAVAEPDAGFDMQAAFVRAAMELRFVHAVEYRTIDVAFASGVEYSGYAAHAVVTSCSCLMGAPRDRAGFVIGALVGGHHGVHAEFLFDPLARPTWPMRRARSGLLARRRSAAPMLPNRRPVRFDRCCRQTPDRHCRRHRWRSPAGRKPWLPEWCWRYLRPATAAQNSPVHA